MREKKTLPRPTWFKNTYFWIALVLFILSIVGLVGGDEPIRDPGQKREANLWLIYLGSAVIMLIGGLLSHRQTVQAYQEDLENPTT